MDKNPTVSVVMAVYNTGAFVGDAIESILNQSLTDFELIIVNDGSTDDSLAVIMAYNDPRIKGISRENKGVVFSRNEAIRLAQGQYIAIMDSDDVSVPDRLEKQVQFLQDNPHIIAVGGQLMRCDKDLNPVKPWQYPLMVHSAKSAYDFAYNTPHNCIMVRTEYMKQVPYRPYFWAGEDYDMLLRLWDMGNFANIPDTVLYYRWHGANVRLNFHVWRSNLSVVTANMCAVLRRTGRSDTVFNDKNLSKQEGFLLYKTRLKIYEMVYAICSILYKSTRQLAILILRRILRKT